METEPLRLKLESTKVGTSHVLNQRGFMLIFLQFPTLGAPYQHVIF
jgi:hypothetical protein